MEEYVCGNGLISKDTTESTSRVAITKASHIEIKLAWPKLTINTSIRTDE